MSLLEPDKKMSKSLGDNHCIYLDDEPEIIKKKISKAVTDSGSGSSQGVQNLIDLVKLVSSSEIYEKFTEDQKAGTLKYSQLKEKLAKDMADYFSEFRKNKKSLSDVKVKKIFDKGSRQARKVAQKTLAEVKSKIGIR